MTSAELAELPSALRLPAEIRRLKKERGAVLLAHYYQESRNPGPG